MEIRVARYPTGKKRKKGGRGGAPRTGLISFSRKAVSWGKCLQTDLIAELAVGMGPGKARYAPGERIDPGPEKV